MKNYEHVNIYEVPDFLVEELDIDTEEPLRFFDWDFDIIKILDRTEYFCLYEYEETIYIISTLDSDDFFDSDFIELLDKFVEDTDLRDSPDSQTWDDFETAEVAIVFRNRDGYRIFVWN